MLVIVNALSDRHLNYFYCNLIIVTRYISEKDKFAFVLIIGGYPDVN